MSAIIVSSTSILPALSKSERERGKGRKGREGFDRRRKRECESRRKRVGEIRDERVREGAEE